MTSNRLLLALLAALLFALPLAAAKAPVGERPFLAGPVIAEPAPGVPRMLANQSYAAQGATLEAMARDFLAVRARELALADPALADLELKAERRGKVIDVVRFRQTAAGYPVYGGEIAVSLNRRGQVIYVANDYRPIVGTVAEAAEISAAAARQTALAALGVAGPLSSSRSELMVFPGADRARLVRVERLAPVGAPVGDWEVLIDAVSGELVKIEDRAAYVDGTGEAFLPDPLSSSGATYGDAGYVDGSDADTAQLVAEIGPVALLGITFNGSIYSLVGSYADCRDNLESPNIPCQTSASGAFAVGSRSNDFFEHQHVYYHIDTYMRYLNETLGIPVRPTASLNFGLVQFDAHGLNGEDNSHYSGGNPQYLAFGDGGVDDAEDADVVIHELGHGIHDWITNGGLSQVQGLSEGLGDYFAVSYSRSFAGQWTPADPEYNWTFSWDGHNPFWNGRLTNWNDNHLYPTGLTGQIHTDGQFWASCNIDVAELIGLVATDEAVLEGISMTGGSTNQAQAAQAVIQAAAELGYGAATLATMASIYNDASGGFGCNYGITVPSTIVFADDFERGNTSRWSDVSP